MWSLSLVNAVGRVVPPHRSIKAWWAGSMQVPGMIRAYEESLKKEEEDAITKALFNLAPQEKPAAYQMILREYFSIRRENSDLTTKVSNLETQVEYYEDKRVSLNQELEELQTRLEKREEEVSMLKDLYQSGRKTNVVLLILLGAAGLTLTYQLLPEKKKSHP